MNQPCIGLERNALFKQCQPICTGSKRSRISQVMVQPQIKINGLSNSTHPSCIFKFRETPATVWTAKANHVTSFSEHITANTLFLNQAVYNQEQWVNQDEGFSPSRNGRFRLSKGLCKFKLSSNSLQQGLEEWYSVQYSNRDIPISDQEEEEVQNAGVFFRNTWTQKTAHAKYAKFALH